MLLSLMGLFQLAQAEEESIPEVGQCNPISGLMELEQHVARLLQRNDQRTW